MDGTSPGGMPLSLGDVWVGETRWQIAGNVAGAAAPGVTVQNCIVDWPTTPWQPWVNPAMAPVVPLQHTHYHFTPAPLLDADVERIAKRVAELIKAAP
jgi:hypothetical protein